LEYIDLAGLGDHAGDPVIEGLPAQAGLAMRTRRLRGVTGN
jgi:hypothetical protein